jgi:hypothetical protein
MRRMRGRLLPDSMDDFAAAIDDASMASAAPAPAPPNSAQSPRADAGAPVSRARRSG